jgi:hypothetical protein
LPLSKPSRRENEHFPKATKFFFLKKEIAQKLSSKFVGGVIISCGRVFAAIV